MSVADDPLVRRLGRRDYVATWQAMQGFTDRRDAVTPDELWIVEHPSVFTQGMNGRPEHLLDPGAVPVVEVDRGGQVTYHGPGQVVAYPLLDLRRRGLGIRELVLRLEFAVIDLLAGYGIEARGRRDAPGVYVDGRKIAALGLRVRRGCSYHGLSFNVDLDLAPFASINPCGYPGLEVIRSVDIGGPATFDEAAEGLVGQLLRQLARPVTPAPAAPSAPSGNRGSPGG